MSSTHYRLTREESYALERIRAKIERAYAIDHPVFTEFISPNLWPHVLSLIEQEHVTAIHFRGHPSSEMVLVGFFQESVKPESIDWPVTLLKVEATRSKEFSHRDLLGSVMALGIKREKMGDLIALGNTGYIFVIDEMAQYLSDNLMLVGNTSVSVERQPLDAITNLEDDYEQKRYSLASLRLDLVVSRVFGISRNEAQELFQKGRVKHNHGYTENYKKNLEVGDLISVRGYGRVRLDEISGKTRKGNQSINFHIFR
jgi:RNA-binding protein YlmH